MTVSALVRPNLLTWARETAGLSVEEAAHLLSVSPEKLAQWEQGATKPTIGQVRKMSEKYKRPLNVFFLTDKPDISHDAPVHDFRTLESGVSRNPSRYLRFALRRMKEWQEDALELSSLLQTEIPEFDLQIDITSNPERSAETIRRWLGIQIEEQLSWSRTDRYVALNEWRQSIESRAVLTFQGSYIELSEMRGASLFSRKMPVILLNSGDTPNGRLFTLIHELVHLALHGSGLCEVANVRPRDPREDKVEIFCNHVAGAVLVPADILFKNDQIKNAERKAEWSNEFISELASEFKVSRFVILRRLLLLGKTNEAFYDRKHREWNRAQISQDSSGGDGRRIALVARGRLFTRLILSAYGERKITLYETAKKLGIKADSVNYAREYAL